MSDPTGGCTGACPSSPQLQLYQTIIFATPVLFAFLLLLMFCLLYFRRHSRSASIHSRMRAQLFADGPLAIPPLQQGLSRSFRQRLPITLFDDQFASTCQDTQCAVCLGDYQLNEKLQQLPVCNHSFHVPCIDEWLAKNATCPICRTSLTEVGNGGFVDPFQSLDANSMELLLRGGDENRMWEDRVVSEVQDQSLQIRSDASTQEGVALSEDDARPTGEHAINIERS